ncbi:FAD-binding oxidoreductase [Leptolyngbya ohadii]|uniref:FAD-binding oxidoreductase n=1 Tax=Leptolyngbya ohadii TaxID=1962290 RepID=UPI000B5A02B8|nr:FAD-binding oxidoreductase [Leptolyngbya ohadii]
MLKLRLIDCKQRDVQDLDLVPSYAGQTGWLVGNNANCDLVLPDSDVDCLYGRIFYYKGLYHFVDLGGKTESLINGEPVPVGNPRQLCEGDLLQVGRTLLYFKAFSVPSTTSERSLSSSPEQDYSQAYLQNYSQSYSQNHFQNHPLERSPTEERICRCTEIIEETADVKTFCLAPESPFAFEYQPGQFVNLQVEINGQSVIRPYTLSSSPSRSGLAITVKRCPAPSDRPDAPIGLVSNWLHDYLQPGDRVRLVGGAMGHFTCLPKVPAKMLLISAGSGITPMMSMSRWLQDRQADCDVVFLHSARTSKDIIFRTELEAMAAQMLNFQLALTVTQPVAKSPWTGLTGRVSASLLRLVAPDLMDRSVYVCGSNAFMQSIRAMLEAMDFPMQNYQAESFGGPSAASLTMSHPS